MAIVDSTKKEDGGGSVSLRVFSSTHKVTQMTYLEEVSVDQMVIHEIHGTGIVLDDKDENGRVGVKFDSGSTRRITVTMLREFTNTIEEEPSEYLMPEVYNEDRVDADLAYKVLHELCNWKF